MVYRRVTQYYSDLAEEYLELTLYKDAEAVATRALTISPLLLHARLKRGIARQKLGMFVAAMIDFEMVLYHRQQHPEALKHRDELIPTHISQTDASRIASIVVRLMASNKVASNATSSDNGTKIETETSTSNSDGLELEVLAYMQPIKHHGDEQPKLDQGDCRGTRYSGSGTACRFYNHRGCNRGTKCTFCHAPDAKSVRDANGKNVCLYYLIGKCKWNADTCIYLHSTDALGELPPATPSSLSLSLSPAPESEPKSQPVLNSDSASVQDQCNTRVVGWWNDPARVAQVLERVQARDARRKQEHEEKETRRLTGDLSPSLPGASEGQDQSQGADSGGTGTGTKSKKKKKKGKGKGKKKAKKGSMDDSSSQNEELVFDWDSDSDLDSGSGFDLGVLRGLEIDEETGYFRDMELMSYGIKPWEFDEAERVLRALENF